MSTSTTAPLTEKNLNMLALELGPRVGHPLFANPTVMDFVAQQAALARANEASTLELPNTVPGRAAATDSESNRREGRAKQSNHKGAEAPAVVRSISPLMQARKATRKSHPADEAQTRAEQSAKETRSKYRTHVERDQIREEQEAKERRVQRKERRQAKALIVRDASTTAAQKMKQKNLKRKKRKTARQDRDDTDSSIHDTEHADQEDSGSEQGHSRDKDVRAAKKRNKVKLTAMKKLDRPKSVAPDKRITLAPQKVGVFNKGVASAKTKASSAGRKRVKAADLVFSELKFLSKPAKSKGISRQLRAGEESDDSDQDGEAEQDGDTEDWSQDNTDEEQHLPRTKAKADHDSKYFGASSSRTAQKSAIDAEIRRLAKARTSNRRRHKYEQTDDDLTDPPTDGLQTDELDGSSAWANQAVQWDRPSHQTQGATPSLLAPEHAPSPATQPRSHSWPMPALDAISAPPDDPYLTQLRPPESANAWRRELLPESSARVLPRPRLYARLPARKQGGSRQVGELGMETMSFPPALRLDHLGNNEPPWSTEAGSVAQSRLQVPTDGDFVGQHAPVAQDPHDVEPWMDQGEHPVTFLAQKGEGWAPRTSFVANPYGPHSFLEVGQEQHRDFATDIMDPALATHNERLQLHQPIWNDQDGTLHTGYSSRQLVDPRLFGANLPVQHEHLPVRGYAEDRYLEQELPSWRISPDLPGETIVDDALNNTQVGISEQPTEKKARVAEEISGVSATQLQHFWEPFRT
ncbi:hypothetical protein V8E36_002122 [Tilletia maclaganii]